MAKRTKVETAKAKAAKQKKIAIGGAVLLVALLAYQVPKMMKMMNTKPKPPIGAPAAGTPDASGATPTAAPATVAPADPNSLAAPTLAGSATSAPVAPAATAELVSAVPLKPDAGQLETFEKFATKDPFAEQVQTGRSPSTGQSSAPSGAPPASSGSSSGRSSGASSGASSTIRLPTVTPPSSSSSSGASQPAAASPTVAAISLNGELLTVTVGTDFPTAGATFSRVGAVFHLVSLTSTTAKIAIAGGSYADGSKAMTLRMGTPLTLQNTADGTKYTLVLQKPSAATATSTSAPPATTPASTTPSVPAVPSGG